jgi:hypothetical protein
VKGFHPQQTPFQDEDINEPADCGNLDGAGLYRCGQGG